MIVSLPMNSSLTYFSHQLVNHYVHVFRFTLCRFCPCLLHFAVNSLYRRPLLFNTPLLKSNGLTASAIWPIPSNPRRRVQKRVLSDGYWFFLCLNSLSRTCPSLWFELAFLSSWNKPTIFCHILLKIPFLFFRSKNGKYWKGNWNIKKSATNKNSEK